MDLKLGILEESIDREHPASSPQTVSGEGDHFSRILALQLGRSNLRREATDATRAKEDAGRTSSRQDPANGERETGRVEVRTDQETTPETQGGISKGEREPSPTTHSSGEPGVLLETWSGLSGPWPAFDPSGTLTATPLAESGPAVPLTDLAPRLAGDIAARYVDRGGVQTLTLRLDPAHLGKVEVVLQAKGDHLSVQLTAANREAESALRENLRDLTEAIGDKAGRFGQVEVKVSLKAETGSDSRSGGDQADQSGERGKEQDSPEDQDGSGRGRQEDPHTEGEHNPTEPGQRPLGG